MVSSENLDIVDVVLLISTLEIVDFIFLVEVQHIESIE
jgi:hypothetical protein